MIWLPEKFLRPLCISRRSSSKPELGRVEPVNACLPEMAIRKVWVRRANASATQVAVGPDDLVDDVRDAVIRKYLNSLGRTFDAPDVALRICPREQANKAGNERVLAPDEAIIRLIDAYYPGGQTVEEALIIDVPQRRTPKASPRPGSHMPSYYVQEEIVPGEAGDYFSPMPALQSPHLHSMAVLTTGQLPPLPSPGGRSNRHRPKAGRQHTSSPTILHSVQANSNLIGMAKDLSLCSNANVSFAIQNINNLLITQPLLPFLLFPHLPPKQPNLASPPPSHLPPASPPLNRIRERRLVDGNGPPTSTGIMADKQMPIVLHGLHRHLQASFPPPFLPSTSSSSKTMS